MTTTAAGQGIGKYVAVYVALLVLTALQFAVGYQNIEGTRLALRMLTFSVIDTILVVLFMMNLSSERRNFFLFVAVFLLFVLSTMNIIWTDSFRLLLFRLTGYQPS